MYSCCRPEFSLASGSQRPGQGGVEWYESAGRSDYNFDTPAPSSSAAAYGTFEDEPPLLEGNGGCTLSAKKLCWGLACTFCQVPSASSLCMCMNVNHQGSSTKCCAVSAELGIDIPGILKRSTCIASSRTRNLDLEGLDMGGPLIFVLLLACIHLLVSVPLRLFTV